MRRSLVPILSLAAGACVPQTAPPAPPPTPVAAAPVAPPPVAAPASDWRDWPLTPGNWRYRADAGGTTAGFGVAGSDPLLTLRCDRATRRMTLSLAGGGGPVTVRTTSLTRVVPLVATGEVAPRAGAMLAAGDPLLDAMAFSRGRLVLARTGAAPLVLPAWAEIGRVTEDCR